MAQTSIAAMFHHSRPATPLLLAFCACYVDVVCIIGLFHTFTAFITGTLVVLCTEIFHQPENAWLKLFVLGVFAASTFFWYLRVERARRANRLSLRLLFLIESGLLAVFMAVTLIGDPADSGPTGGVTLLAVGIATVAMALQNVIMFTILNQHAPTTIMTGNLLKMIVAVVEGLRPEHAREEPMKKAKYQGQVALSFAAGGLLGSLMMALVGFWALGVPVGALGLLAVSQEWLHPSPGIV